MSDSGTFTSRVREKLTVNELKSTPIRYLIGLAFIGWLLVAPSLGLMETLGFLDWTRALFFLMFVLSWDFVVGYTGQVSFGHTLFFTAGGYTTAILNIKYGVDPLVGIAIGTVVATVSGLIYALPALRLGGDYLALFTLLPPIILLSIFQRFRDFTVGHRPGARSGWANSQRGDALLPGSGFVHLHFRPLLDHHALRHG
jgi:branched-chain amino acid transport system permease protein